MRRRTKHFYREPGSFERVLEAALAYANASTEDDNDYHRQRARLRAAVIAFALRVQRPTRARSERPDQPGLFGNMTRRGGSIPSETDPE